MTVYDNVLGVTREESELWWFAKYMGIRCLFERGEGRDIQRASAALSLLQTSRPSFDNGRFGMKDRFTALGAEIRKAEGK